MTRLYSWPKNERKKRRETAKIKKKKFGEQSEPCCRLGRSKLFISLNNSVDLALFNVRRSQCSDGGVRREVR